MTAVIAEAKESTHFDFVDMSFRPRMESEEVRDRELEVTNNSDSAQNVSVADHPPSLEKKNKQSGGLAPPPPQSNREGGRERKRTTMTVRRPKH